jgi:hypothetical protein
LNWDDGTEIQPDDTPIFNDDTNFQALDSQSQNHKVYNLNFFKWVGMIFQNHLKRGTTLRNATGIDLELYFTESYALLLKSGKGPRRLASPASCYGACDYRNEVEWYKGLGPGYGTQENDKKILNIAEMITKCMNGDLSSTFTLLDEMENFATNFFDQHSAYMAAITSLREAKAAAERQKRQDEITIKEEDKNALDIFGRKTSKYRMLAEGYVHQPTPSSQSSQEAKCDNTVLSPYQSFVKSSIRPQSQVKRLIVAHRVGAGKTKTMISVFNNYDDDPRARLLLFSTSSLMEQFFVDLMEEEEDTRFRRNLRSKDKKTASDVSKYLKEYSGNIVSDSKKFAYKGKVESNATGGDGIKFLKNPLSSTINMLCGPVFAATYEDLINQNAVESRKTDSPTRRTTYTGFFEWGKKHNNFLKGESSNLLDNMIVLMDEIHVGLKEKIMVDLLFAAKHSVVVGFTGTIPKDKEQTFAKVFGKKVPGDVGPPAYSLQDSIHYFNGTGNNMFFEFSDIKYVEVDMGGFQKRQRYRALNIDNSYDLAYKEAEQIDLESTAHLHLTFTSTLDSDDISMYEVSGKLPEGTGLQNFAPIVYRLVEDVKKYLISELNKKPVDRRGAMILSSQSTGFALISYLLKKLNQDDNKLSGKCGHMEVTGFDPDFPDTTVAPTTGKESVFYGSEELLSKTKMWNNTKGEGLLQIFLIDTDIVKEGLNVLRIGKVFSNSDYESYSEMVQTYGRADRRCSPQSLTVKNDDQGTFIKLDKIQYLPKPDVDDPVSQLMHNKFKQLQNEYALEKKRSQELTDYSRKI